MIMKAGHLDPCRVCVAALLVVGSVRTLPEDHRIVKHRVLCLIKSSAVTSPNDVCLVCNASNNANTPFNDIPRENTTKTTTTTTTNTSPMPLTADMRNQKCKDASCPLKRDAGER